MPRERGHRLTMLVALLASLLLHGSVLIPCLLLAMQLRAGEHARIETNPDAEQSAPPPSADEQSSHVDLGIEKGVPSSMNWIGYDTWEKHLAMLAETEQPALGTEQQGPPQEASPTIIAAASPAQPPQAPQPPSSPSSVEAPAGPEGAQPANDSGSKTTTAATSSIVELHEPRGDGPIALETSLPTKPTEATLATHDQPPIEPAPMDPRTAPLPNAPPVAPPVAAPVTPGDPGTSQPSEAGKPAGESARPLELPPWMTVLPLVRSSGPLPPAGGIADPDSKTTAEGAGAQAPTGPPAPTDAALQPRSPAAPAPPQPSPSPSQQPPQPSDAAHAPGSEAQPTPATPAAPTASPGAPGSPGSPGSPGVMVPGQPAQSPGRGHGAPSDKDVDPTSIIKVPRELWQSGRPLAAKGLELKPRRPSFTLLTQLTASPCNPVCLIRFRNDGVPSDARLLRTSCDLRTDRAIEASLFGWRATGAPLQTIKGEQTIDIVVEIILVQPPD